MGYRYSQGNLYIQTEAFIYQQKGVTTTMKKLFCLLLSAVLLLSLFGCVPNTDIRGEIETPSSSTTLQGEVETPTNSTTASSEAEDSSSDGPEFSLGTTENNRYHNDYFGISCNLPSGWSFYTDEQIRELNNITMDALDSDVVEALENAAIIYDMYAENPTDLLYTNVIMEKLTALQLLTLDIKATLESQFPALKTAYANMGYTNTQVSYQKTTVGGKEYDGMMLTAQIQGIDFYAVSFCYVKNSYLVNISVSSLVTDETNTLLSYYTIS